MVKANEETLGKEQYGNLMYWKNPSSDWQSAVSFTNWQRWDEFTWWISTHYEKKQKGIDQFEDKLDWHCTWSTGLMYSSFAGLYTTDLPNFNNKPILETSPY